MKKIPTVLVRDPEDRAHVLSEVTPGCGWVLAGEGVATRKYDGTCVMFDGDRWWARREVKAGKTAPAEWFQADLDETTGKRVGWEPATQSPFAKFHAEALENTSASYPPGSTWELCGPKINANPERLEHHQLISHALAEVVDLPAPLTVETIQDALRDLGGQGWEGIVWHHPDGRMAKLKYRDLRRR